MKVSVDELVKIIVKEILLELEKQGVQIDYSPTGINKSCSVDSQTVFEVDMSNYKSPVLTENIALSIPSQITELILPTGTVITPCAREIILKKKFKLTFRENS